MRSACFWAVAIAVFGLPCLTCARLPSPPSEAQARQILERIHLRARADTTAETRARLEQIIDDTVGERERLLNHSGVLLVLKGYPNEALWCLTEAALRQLQPDSLNNIGLQLAMLDRHGDAEQLLLYVTGAWPEFTTAYINLGRVYCDLGRFDLANECAQLAAALEPGRQDNERLQARICMQQGDVAGAARHAVNWGHLDPGDPMLPEFIDALPPEQVAEAMSAVARTIPLPRRLIELPEIEEDVREFVDNELATTFWGQVFEHCGRQGALPQYQAFQLTPEVWEQLPAEARAMLEAQGFGPEAALSVPNPAASRHHYMVLASTMEPYATRFIDDVKQSYESRRLLGIIHEEMQRQAAYTREYMEALGAQVNPVVAGAHWARQALPSIEATHARIRDSLAAARPETVRHTRRYWQTISSMASMLPAEYRDDESRWLQQTTQYHNMQYAGAITAWYRVAMQAVFFERMLDEAAPGILHAAADARAFEAWLNRPERVEEWDDSFDFDHLGEDISLWVGLNLGIVALKYDGHTIGLSGGEGIVGDVSYHFGREELTIGIGVGANIPIPSPASGSGRVLAVMRIGGERGLDAGLRTNVQVGAGTPIAGVDVNIVDHYVWVSDTGRR